jgi:hypothetical protein
MGQLGEHRGVLPAARLDGREPHRLAHGVLVKNSRPVVNRRVKSHLHHTGGFTPGLAESCPHRIGTQFVRCDDLTGLGVRAPFFVPES